MGISCTVGGLVSISLRYRRPNTNAALVWHTLKLGNGSRSQILSVTGSFGHVCAEQPVHCVCGYDCALLNQSNPPGIRLAVAKYSQKLMKGTALQLDNRHDSYISPCQKTSV